MATLTIKNLPDDVYGELKSRATLNRRSINGEAIVCLEQALSKRRRDPREVLEEIKALRDKMPPLRMTESQLRKAKRFGRL